MLILISAAFCHRASVSFTSLSSECEILGVDLFLPNAAPFSVINAYFPSGVTSIRPLDAALASCKPHCVLAGDFNSHHISWGSRTDACGRRLWEWIGDNNLSCHNSGATTCVRGQSRSAVDLTLSTPGLVTDWDTVPDATNSDHVPVLFEVVCSDRTPNRRVQSFVNMTRFGKELRTALPSLTHVNEDRVATEVLNLITETAVRSKFTVSSVRDGPCTFWWIDECTREYRRRNAAWKRLLRNQCPANWSNFKFIRAIFKRTIAKAKEQYKLDRFSLLSDPRRKSTLFKLLRSWKVAPPDQNADSAINSPDETQDFLNRIALGLHTRFTSVVPPILTGCGQDDFEEVTMEDLHKALRLAPDAAPGPDNITVRMLKLLFSESPACLLHVVNHSLRHSWVPPEWRLAQIVPLLKKQGLGSTIDNIRPIALTSNLVKLIERILLTRIENILESHNILSPKQIGFRPGCSIWSAHIELESRIHLARSRREVAVLVTLDVAKAYDSVEYQILSNSIKRHPFPKYIISWIISFLTNRNFFLFTARSVLPSIQSNPRCSSGLCFVSSAI